MFTTLNYGNHFSLYVSHCTLHLKLIVLYFNYTSKKQRKKPYAWFSLGPHGSSYLLVWAKCFILVWKTFEISETLTNLFKFFWIISSSFIVTTEKTARNLTVQYDAEKSQQTGDPGHPQCLRCGKELNKIKFWHMFSMKMNFLPRVFKGSSI